MRAVRRSMNTLCCAFVVFTAACIIPAAGHAQSARLPILEPTIVEVDLDRETRIDNPPQH
jgi:hypothetical protein